jgi:hypothetical protein
MSFWPVLGRITVSSEGVTILRVSNTTIVVFANLEQEILHRTEEADRGCSKAQHRLGSLLMQKKYDLKALHEAYKWLFISVVLGNESAKDELAEVNKMLGEDEIDPGFELATEWLAEKFDEDINTKEEEWSMELLKWRFSPSAVH